MSWIDQFGHPCNLYDVDQMDGPNDTLLCILDLMCQDTSFTFINSTRKNSELCTKSSIMISFMPLILPSLTLYHRFSTLLSTPSS